MVINLKYQLRQGLFLIPLIVIPFFIMTNSYVVPLLFLQGKFFRVFKQNDFNFQLLHITGSDLNKLLYSYNLSWTIWFNAWFLIALLINCFWFNRAAQDALVIFVDFNIALFVSFIVGNTISNSDMITLKSSILRTIGSSFIFGISISLSYAILQILQWLNVSILINFILLLGVILAWRYHTKQQKRIKYIPYYL